jgi:hypothetical protein
MAMPAAVFGAPAALAPASIAGLSASANPTTTISQANKRAALITVNQK